MKSNESFQESKILSICIPAYNRINKTYETVKNILSYAGNDIEVVVLDNCSTDNTELVLQGIKDERFKYFRNIENIGSMPNLLNSLNLGTGKFVMLCLDKDNILPSNISEFIELLKNFDDIVIGQCSLNTENNRSVKIYNRGLSSLLNLSFKSEHPSGLFIKRSKLLEMNVINEILENDRFFPFNTEFIKSKLFLEGNAARIEIPLVFTESLESCEKEISHTYTNDNIYFLPSKIILTFNEYIKNLDQIALPARDKTLVIKQIYYDLLRASTLSYRSIMDNKSICNHHGIKTRSVSRIELLNIQKKFYLNVIKSHKGSLLKINLLLFLANIKIFLRIIF